MPRILNVMFSDAHLPLRTPPDGSKALRSKVYYKENSASPFHFGRNKQFQIQGSSFSIFWRFIMTIFPIFNHSPSSPKLLSLLANTYGTSGLLFVNNMYLNLITIWHHNTRLASCSSLCFQHLALCLTQGTSSTEAC